MADYQIFTDATADLTAKMVEATVKSCLIAVYYTAVMRRLLQ